jgi:glycosyltransferase involved in cell wall biosynthesis
MNARTVSLVLATSTGGVGTHVLSLARGLMTTGWRVRVFGPESTDQLFGFQAAGAEFWPVEIGGGVRGVSAVRALRPLVRASSITHAHGLRAGAVAAAAEAPSLVVTWHNAQLETTTARRTFATMTERFVSRRAVVNLAASEDLALHLRQLGGHDVRFAPVAISLAASDRPADDVRAELGMSPGQLLVLAVGRLHPQKGLDVLVAAAARWSASEVLVAIAGDGPLRDELRAQIEAAGAPVQLLGRRDDVADLFAAADLVVLPSRWEARSLAAQEALLAGRPLVATRVGGLPALLGDGAVLVAPDDIDALDTAVQTLLASPDQRADLATRGRARTADWPTEAATIAQIDAIYTELLGAAR